MIYKQKPTLPDRIPGVRNIYVASSWRNPFQPIVVQALLEMGHTVYDFRDPQNAFQWKQLDPAWEHWTVSQYLEKLNTEEAERGFESDFSAMQAADTFVLVMPCGRSAHLELGWAAGRNILTVVFFPEESTEPELMVKMCDYLVHPFGALLDLFELSE